MIEESTDRPIYVRRLPVYPIGQSAGVRAVELWLLLQQFVQQHAASITVQDLNRYDHLFGIYWAACAALGMHIGDNHPLDELDP